MSKKIDKNITFPIHPKRPRIYEGCSISQIIDGDTLEILVDLGFKTYVLQVFRLFGINTPEIKGSSKKQGFSIRLKVAEIIPLNSQIKVESFQDIREKYGRYLAKIYYIDSKGQEICLNEQLVKEGFAKVINY